MSKISTYPSADTPLLLSDRLIGTEAIRTPPTSTPLATKNFSLGELLQLFSSNFPAASLQAVLNTGNTATQNITLIGTIDATLIKPTNIEDTSGSQGTVFQYLSKGTSSINWVDLPVSNLQAILDAGNTAAQNINLVGNIATTKIIPGNIQDDTSGIGTTGQLLSKTATGIRWINNPTPSTAGLADVLSVGNTATNNIILNGYIKPTNIKDSSDSNGSLNQVLSIGAGGLEWIDNTPSVVTSLTVTGSSGPSTLIAGVLNVPTYTLSGLDGQPLSTNLTSLSGLTYSSLGFVKMSAAGTFTLDTSTYLTGITSSDVTTALGYTPVTNTRTLTINGVTYDLTADRSWTIATSPLTTKGDLYTFSTIDARLPIGLDTQVLLADSSTATGLKWGTNTAATPTGYYGAFSDVTDQFATVIDVGYPMLLGVTDLTNGVTVVSGSRVTIANTGIYNIQWSAQFRNPTASEHDVTIWLRKNGADVSGSAGVVLVPPKHGSADGHVLPSWNFLLDPIAGDYYEFVWSTVNTSVYISFEPAGNPPPSTASVVLTVTQQSGIMAGTGITGLGKAGSIQTGAVQTLAVGTSGTDFDITSSGNTQTFNLPDAGPTARGVITTGAQTLAGEKTFLNPTLIKSDYNALRLTSSVYSPGSAGNVMFFDVFDGTLTYSSINARTNGGGASNDLILQSPGNGNVGIGTIAPTAKLDVNGDVKISDGLEVAGTVVLPSTTSIGDVSDIEIGYLNGVTSPIQPQIDAVNVNVITITTAVSIDTDTTSGAYGQHGRHNKISNGANAINIQCVSTSNADFVASYEKIGSGTITFTAGAGITLTTLSGTAAMTGVAGSKACLSRNGSIYYLQITNY